MNITYILASGGGEKFRAGTTDDIQSVARGLADGNGKIVYVSFHETREEALLEAARIGALSRAGKEKIAAEYCGSFARRVLLALLAIPRGKVTTYGILAAAAGCPGAARAVGNILHSNPEPDAFPCFRVVNSKGGLARSFGFGGPAEQQRRLENDGIAVNGGRVDLGEYLYTFGPEELL